MPPVEGPGQYPNKGLVLVQGPGETARLGPVAIPGPVHIGCSRGWSHSSTATTGRPETPPEGGGGDRTEGAGEVEEAGAG